MGLKKIDLGMLQSISKILGDTDSGFTGTEITDLLSECNIADLNPSYTKWKRIYAALSKKQEMDKCSNNLLNFFQTAMNPARNYNNNERFNNIRSELNGILSLSGLFLREDGIFEKTSVTKTLSEASAKVYNLKKALKDRKSHPDIIKFCKEELISDNYFHAVLEAVKSVAEKIRNKTSLEEDGSELVEKAFSFKKEGVMKIPHLAINTLASKSEQSEQTGFMNLLKGLFGMFRNCLAHEPKIIWKLGEQDALDILSLISLMHRRLDNATPAIKNLKGFDK